MWLASGVFGGPQGSFFLLQSFSSLGWRIRQMDLAGKVTTWVGEGYCKCDGGICIRKIDVKGKVTTVAGKPPPQGSQRSPGFQDGDAKEALFAYPNGLYLDKQGSLFITDSLNHRVRVLRVR